MLGKVYLGNSLEAWLWFLGVVIVFALALNFVLKRFTRLFAGFAEKTETDFDDLVVALAEKTSFVLIIIFSLYLGTFFLVINEQIEQLRRTVVSICVLIQVGFWGSGFISYYVTKKLSKIDPGSGAVITHLRTLGFVAKTVLWTILLIIGIDRLGFNPAAIIAGLGVGGIAVALAMQNVLGDLIASLSIIFDKPFQVGDFVVVGEMSGDVEHIGLKTTRIRSLSGEQLVFSNNDLLQSRIKNYKRMDTRRVLFSIGVVYETPYEKLKSIPCIIREIIDGEPNARFSRAHFNRFDDFALNYDVVYHVLTPDFRDYMDIQQNVNLNIFRKFSEEGIEFAYPTRKIFLGQSADSHKKETGD